MLFGAPAAAAWLAGVALLAAITLNAGYAQALGAQGRSARRILGDRRTSQHVAVGFVVPLVASLVALIAGHRPRTTVWDFSHAELAAMLIAAAALFVVVVLSSLVDWYYIRPRIDAVVRDPPCLADGNQKAVWKRVTRRWYLHRGLAAVAYFAFALVLALVLMLMLAREHPTAAGVVGGVSGIAGLLLIFFGSFRSQLPVVADWTISPAFVVGDDLSYKAYKWKGRGYVLHVSVPRVKLVPLDEDGNRTDTPFVERRNSDLAESDLDAKPASACAGGCVRLNPECLRHKTKENARLDRRRRLLII
jgi:hypothetical protein